MLGYDFCQGMRSRNSPHCPRNPAPTKTAHAFESNGQFESKSQSDRRNLFAGLLRDLVNSVVHFAAN